jgi:hypothetical protein
MKGMIEMKKSFIVVCTLLCFCLAACAEQGVDVQTSSELLDNQATIPPQVTDASEQTTITLEEPSTPTPTLEPIPPTPEPSTPPQQRTLRVSDIEYTLSSSSEPDSGCINEDLIPHHKSAYNIYILMDLITEDEIQWYIRNVQSKMSIQDEMNYAGLYGYIHHFGISLEDLLNSPHGRNYCKDILRAMYLPREERIAVTMRPVAAFLNGNVYNIKTLNELFRDDKEEFARFNLDDLIDFQERLEEYGIFYGFNQDMVDFAIQNNR